MDIEPSFSFVTLSWNPLTHTPPSPKTCMENPLLKWIVNNGQSILHTKYISKKETSPLLPLNQTQKEKEQGTLNACLGLPIDCMKFLFSIKFITLNPLQRTPHLLGTNGSLYYINGGHGSSSANFKCNKFIDWFKREKNFLKISQKRTIILKCEWYETKVL